MERVQLSCSSHIAATIVYASNCDCVIVLAQGLQSGMMVLVKAMSICRVQKQHSCQHHMACAKLTQQTNCFIQHARHSKHCLYINH